MSDPSRRSSQPRGQEPPVPVFRSLTDVPSNFGPTVAAIGNFDGVHLGHREILGAAVLEARSSGVRSLAITFSPHPERFLRPATAPRLITPDTEERVRLLSAAGVDAVLVLPFDRELARIPGREFAKCVLAETLQVRAVHEGQSFRFGHRAAAGVKELALFGAEFGFAVHVHDAVRVRGLEVSSSAVRAMISAGDVRRARWMLGRRFAVRSTQARGRGIGSRLLVPTVNLAEYDGLLPGFGVYVTCLRVAGRSFQAVTNVGNRPTFGEASFAVESHILDFEPVDLGESTPLELEFLYRLRGEKKWDSPEALKQQILKDAARAKRYFGLLK
ncbi:MAG: bifunctional riboflavin kinase/FAD synthetase [Acidobacteriota bacterium]